MEYWWTLGERKSLFTLVYSLATVSPIQGHLVKTRSTQNKEVDVRKRLVEKMEDGQGNEKDKRR